MGTIYDIGQNRQLLRCKSTQIVLTPTLVNLGILSATDTLANYFASTNHLINHTAEMIIRVTAADPTTAFPIGSVSFIAGFVFPAKQCQAPNQATDQYYAINGVQRNGLNNYVMLMRRHGTNDNAILNGIQDTDFSTLGVDFRLQITNRHVVWFFRKTGTVPWLTSSSFLKQAEPVFYASGDLEGRTPPAGGRYRWNGSDPRSGGTNKPTLETLIPMFTIRSACNVTVLSVTSGETPTINVPVQP